MASKETWFKNRVEVPGETIFEIVTEGDGVDFGVAEVEIIDSLAHFHKETREVYILLSGKLEIRLNDKTVVLENYGETVTIPQNVVHSAKSLGYGPAGVLIVTMPAWTQADHHLVSC